MSDDELRALLRARDASPGDVTVARRAALLASRGAGREEAAEPWQEVLRRSPRDPEAEQRLRGLGCELLYRSTVLGIERFESTLDRVTLARTPSLPGLFVGERPVTNDQFLRFMEARGSDPDWMRGVLNAPVTLQGIGRDGPCVHATWQGARAYAEWAHGRLLEPEEWTKLLVLRVYGWNLSEEWVSATRSGDRGLTEHGIVGPSGLRWARERAHWEGPAFRYARTTWFGVSPS
ncbi:MAG TPA: SUMF1/EgtB/PvdO family nonheme iron enzyme [Planctomycetota bacterium]|nr:SUMF1/EgtB/PvdO family nonheme iron enzyme [Planctomycetota bacterium]